jgi:hypothetical protein
VVRLIGVVMKTNLTVVSLVQRLMFLVVAACVLLICASRGGAVTQAAGCAVTPRPPHGFLVGDVSRVYAIPSGCVWVEHGWPPSQKVPVIVTRINGRTVRHPLTARPLGKAGVGICWLDTFTVTWPYVTVATQDGVLVGGPANGGCGGSAAWVMRWRKGGFQTAFTSPPG